MDCKLRGERARHIMHAAFHHADTNVLHRSGKQPGKVGAERVVGGKRAVQPAGGKEIAHLRRLKGLLHPGPRALELEAVVVDSILPNKLLGQRRRRRV
jgi:hypothetical protein